MIRDENCCVFHLGSQINLTSSIISYLASWQAQHSSWMMLTSSSSKLSSQSLSLRRLSELQTSPISMTAAWKLIQPEPGPGAVQRTWTSSLSSVWLVSMTVLVQWSENLRRDRIRVILSSWRLTALPLTWYECLQTVGMFHQHQSHFPWIAEQLLVEWVLIFYLAGLSAEAERRNLLKYFWENWYFSPSILQNVITRWKLEI